MTPTTTPHGWRSGQASPGACPPRRSGRRPRASTRATRWAPAASASTPGATPSTRAAATPPAADLRGTSPVGWYGPDNPDPRAGRQSGASPCGVEEMAGNVWEWTATLYAADYTQATQQAARDSTSSRSLRGGSWIDDPISARAAFRLPLRSRRRQRRRRVSSRAFGPWLITCIPVYTGF